MAFVHRVVANVGELRISFLIVLLEWKFSKTCSSSDSSFLGSEAAEAIASCKALILSVNEFRMPSAPPTDTCIEVK